MKDGEGSCVSGQDWLKQSQKMEGGFDIKVLLLF